MVKDQVNLNAEILLVAGAPDADALAYGYPFAGMAGVTLKEWLRHAGIKREDLYITYLLPDVQAESDEVIDTAIKRNPELGDNLTGCSKSRVLQLADGLPNLKVVVTLGNYATRAFTNYGNTVQSAGTPDITSVRGSVFKLNRLQDRTIYCIPMLTTESVRITSAWQRRCILDWQKVARIRSEGPRKIERHHRIYPTIDEIREFRDGIHEDNVISFDIETWGGSIKCVGFAQDELSSFVIPTEEWAWKKIEGKTSRAKQALNESWKLIKEILEHPVDKVAQNGLFDCWWLAQPEYGIRVQGYHWDTLGMHHALAPNESHALHFLASIFTDEPYWKDEAKEADAIVKVAKQGMDKLYIYNGLDVTVTWEIFSVLYDTLVEQGRTQFYLSHYADMHYPLLRLMLKGAPVNRELVVESRRAFMAEAVRLRDEASLTAGETLFKFNSTQLERDMIEDYYVNGPGIPLGETPEVWLQKFIDTQKVLKSGKVKSAYNPDTVQKKWAAIQEKGISDYLLNKVLYRKWHCPTGKYTDTGKEKADNVALKVLYNKVKDRKRGDLMDHKDNILRLIDVVLEHRRQRKLATFVAEKRIDSDDRMRCTYKFTTTTGRLASSSNPRGTGTNLQNQDRAIRKIFVASPGRVLLECDLSQAEGRVVKALSGCPAAIQSAKRLPTEGDEHTENAIKIFSVFYQREMKFEEITKDLRQIGKKVVHASNYDQGKFGLSDTLLKEGFTMTPHECAGLIRAHRETNPYIDEYQRAVRRLVISKMGLYTSWGRHISFENIRLDDELYKFAYAWTPQSEIGDLTNQRGLKLLSNHIEEDGAESDLILQCHDSVVVDAVPEEVYWIMTWLKTHLEKPRIYGECFGHRVELSIPVEFKIGLNWGEGKEFKSMPTKEVVNDYIKRLLG